MRIHRASLMVAAGLLAACGSYGNGNSGSSPSGSSTAVSIEAQDFKFVPASLSLKPGDSVTLTIKNTGKKEHNFSLDGTSVSKDVEAGETATVTFTVPGGDGAFHCKYHKAGGMVGTLMSSGGGAQPAPTTSAYSSY